jgi:predicted dienelactone hydrolase
MMPTQTRIAKTFRWLTPLTVWAICTTVSAVQAAERIEFGFGSFEYGVSLKELTAYGAPERMSKEQAAQPVQNSIPQRGYSIATKDRQYLQQMLTRRWDFKPRQVSQFFHSAVGEKILVYLGDLVETGGNPAQPAMSGANRNLNAVVALRTGLVTAAADRQGLSLLTFVRKYPAPTMRLNLARGFEVANKIDAIDKKTQTAISGVEQLSSELTRSEPKIEPKAMPKLASPGQYPIKLQPQILHDLRRKRRFAVDFYLPQGLRQPAPVIVFSHGLASDRQHFAATARHLASHGFVAVTVEHPGSNLQQFKNLLGGASKEIFDVSEFIDRPQDVSYVLDDLDRRFPRLANVQQAGVIGHSFGGYTALALAGATIDFDYLMHQCSQGINATNISLLLQCEALKLPRKSYNFRDSRFKLASAISPVDSSIFGPKGMANVQIPVAIAAASEDIVASPVLEQLKPFSWLVAPDRYLFVVRGVGHVADVRSVVRAFMPSLESVIPDQNIEPLREYSRIFILALVQTHVANRSSYRSYLQAGYAQAISNSPNQISILRTLTPAQFTTIFTLDSSPR